LNPAAAIVLRRDHRIALRLEVVCGFAAVRAATHQVRGWLAEQGLTEPELAAWELALVEAANNAVKYASEPARKTPILIEISLGEREVEARITDHTGGFDWPAEIRLPEADAEGGRGLFLIKSLTDHVVYYRHPGENVLVMRRARPAGGLVVPLDAARLQQRLAETESVLQEMTAELSSTYESLVALFRYSAELGAHTDVKTFSQRLIRDLMQLTEADCAVFRLAAADGAKLEPLLVVPDEHKLPDLSLKSSHSAEVAAAQHRQDIWFDAQNPLAKEDPLRIVMPVGGGVCHAFYVADQLVGTAVLGRVAAGRPFTAAQVNLLHSFIDFLAIQIVNARLMNERTVSRVTRRELEIAAEIQRSLLPSELPACRPFDLAAACQSAQKVGGDFYDVISADDGSVLVVIADVMGKGVPAALFAAVLRSTIRSMPHLFAEPGRLLDVANHTLFPDLSRVDMFATACLVYVNSQRRELSFASAGHCPLLLCQPGGAQAEVCNNAGFPLGIEPHVVYTQHRLPLPPGAAALVYTDGLSELRNADGAMLGEERLNQLFATALGCTRDAAGAKQYLLDQMAAFRSNAPLSDDQTLVLIRHLT
jgi:serine phosphatase RsbU (regulator of sigma subunit)/anti-sigma regulatory factor (Ser/Thr protein kinase)